ncbi:UNVERIFIED_CONTAM: hypothetical protein RMT77_017735 [Armadillidium vulgare]
MKITKCSYLIKRIILISITILVVTSRSGSAVELQQTNEPISIQNGSVLGVIIDCPYELGPNDDTEGLEIKWYYNDKQVAVYQWIPGNDPQDFGKLKGRLDLSYEASTHHKKKYRALAIIQPTSELTGKYTCVVSTFSSENRTEVLLTVYTPTNKMHTNYERVGRDEILISCSADGLYPKPNLSLFRFIPSSEIYRIEESKTYTEFENGTYSIYLEKNFKYSELDESNFVCTLSIPNTEFQLEREIAYCPDDAGKLECTKLLVVFSSLVIMVISQAYDR